MGIYFGGNEYAKLYAGGSEASRVLARGQTYHAPAPARPRHTLTIRAGGNSNTVGFNMGNWGSVVTGSTNTYTTPGGTSVEITHLRRIRNTSLVFAICGTGITTGSINQFPARIVAKRTGQTDLVAVRPNRVRAISMGIRADYTVQSGSLTDVFAANQNTTVELWDT